MACPTCGCQGHGNTIPSVTTGGFTTTQTFTVYNTTGANAVPVGHFPIGNPNACNGIAETSRRRTFFVEY